MRFLRGWNKSNDAEVALLKHNCVFALWRLQSESLDIIKRGLQAGCIAEQQATKWEQEMNRSRIELQDSFLLVMTPDQVKGQFQQAEKQFAGMVRQITSTVRDRERAMPVEERVRNLVAGFDTKFKQAQAQGLIDRIAAGELRQQSEMYFSALRRNLDDPNMRANIKTNLVHELVDDYYRSVNQIFSEAISRKKRS